ncbi:hypothetical protein [Aquisphaera insulae]|uniref:hypothetical protein n=1 Tax=Aquisphaera insulae TaxID=2712864 RepID=UPI0013EA782F|nr:hypothetical protein [Aquisphaera insulae]
MTNNPILDELYAIRERLLAEAGGDLHRFLDGLRDREAVSDRLLVREGGEPDRAELPIAGSSPPRAAKPRR